VSTAALGGPLRRFLEQLDGLRPAGIPDMGEVGRLLAELAAAAEFFGPLIAQIPAAAPGGTWLIRPERGPRLVLFHRPEGVMACTHSHHCSDGDYGRRHRRVRDHRGAVLPVGSRRT